MNYDSDEEKPEDPLPPNKMRYCEMTKKQYTDIVRCIVIFLWIISKVCHEILGKGKLDKDTAVEICAKAKQTDSLAKTGIVS